MIDVLFINPPKSQKIYQDLSNEFSSIEPPTWALLLAESCRSKNFTVDILDVSAENLSFEAVSNKIGFKKPRLICFVVYGQNVNAGTASMAGAVELSNYLKEVGIGIPISFIGSYIQALPIKTLTEEPSIDFGFTNEGVYALHNLLSQQTIDVNNLKDIKGLVWRENKKVKINAAERIVPNSKMDVDLPGYAWDLLPYIEKPLDLYRAPMWHAEYNTDFRSPYAAIQTSLGCQFSCDFCMINILNRDNEDEIGIASNYSGMRYWTTDFVIKQIEILINLGVFTIKITDEMFLLNKKHFTPICEILKNKNYSSKLRMWAYSRVDTIKNLETLKLLRSAGIKWLALGIESSDKKIRLEVSKGRFEDVDIQKVIQQVHDANIEVMANYIFGLPGDTVESMQNTLSLSKELNTLGWNGYAAMALPGSKLYFDAIKNNVLLPSSYEGYSFYSYESHPLSNEFLDSATILDFRDKAFIEYQSNEVFLKKIKHRFGEKAVSNIKNILKVKLKRKIIDEK